MPSLTIDLGEIRLCNSRLNVDIQSQASATFLAPIASVVQTPTDLLEGLRSHSVWACRGIGLQLALCFLADGHPPVGEHFPSILPRLSQHLEGAELWRQLNLDIKAVKETSSNETTAIPAGLTFAISHAEPETDTRRRLHRFGEGIAPHDIKPPASVQSVFLSGVVIVVEFCSENSEMLNNLDDDEHHTYTRHETCDRFDFEDILATIDGVLRHWISPGTHRLASSLRTVVNGRKATLAELVPSVWQQGYIQALADRTCLVPTITHAISRFAAATSTSHVSPGSKPARLLNATSQAASDDESNLPIIADSGQPRTQPSRNQVHGKLWTIAQRRLYQSFHRTSLRPLVTPTKAVLNNMKSDNDMLMAFPNDNDTANALCAEDSGDDFFGDNFLVENEELDGISLYDSEENCSDVDDGNPWHDLDDFGADKLLEEHSFSSLQEELHEQLGESEHHSVQDFMMDEDNTPYGLHDSPHRQKGITTSSVDHDTEILCLEMLTRPSNAEVHTEARSMLGAVENSFYESAGRQIYESRPVDPDTMDDLLLCQSFQGHNDAWEFENPHDLSDVMDDEDHDLLSS